VRRFVGSNVDGAAAREEVGSMDAGGTANWDRGVGGARVVDGGTVDPGRVTD